MAKTRVLYTFCLLFIVVAIGIVLYRSNQIDNSHPSFVKEFLDNPETEQCDSACALAAVNANMNSLTSKVSGIEVKMATIENSYTDLDEKIRGNTESITKTSNDLLLLKTELDQKDAELASAASEPTPPVE